MPLKKLLFCALLLATLLSPGCPSVPEPGWGLAELEIKTAPGGLIARPLRPQGLKDIRYIMLHAISDAAANPTTPFELARIEAIFRDNQVESHYVIDRAGQIYRFVPDNRMARHAGRGLWADDPLLTNNMNRYAIGIELLGIGSSREMLPVIGSNSDALVRPEDRGFTEEQYAALNLLLDHLMGRYAIPPENILTHQQYDPQRKWDPGELFQWEKLHL